MNMLEELKMLVEVTDGSQDAILTLYLKQAKRTVSNYLYPFGTGYEPVPRKYDTNILSIAVYLYNRQGSEGETAHSENGINRTYASADIPKDYFKGIVPMVGGF